MTSRGKRPLGAYMLFSVETRPTLKVQHPDWKFGEIGRELGKQWKALAESAKAKYAGSAAKGQAAWLAAHPKKVKPGAKSDKKKPVKKGK
jgi:hypothetical protein